MGIKGLLPLLKSIHKPCNLQNFAGQTIGVDAYGWLHRGTIACAMELATGKPTRKFVDFAMHRVRMLQHFGVIPYLVFDGDYLPSKAATESDREKRREESKRLALELEKAGKPSQAYTEYQKAIDVTPEMARQLIDELKKNGVQYVVAPYEADAQMVYLETKGIISAIISEDSDLLVFGAKCLLTKLDQYGNCIEINKSSFCAVREINLAGWSDTEFRRMAILSGCDYLPSINSMGLKNAYRLVRKYKAIEKIIQVLRFDGKYSVPKGYLEDFNRAELTFLHQRVYCPFKKELVFHTEPAQHIKVEEMPFIGAFVKSQLAQGVAMGDLNPMSKKPIVLEQQADIFSTRNRLSTSRCQIQKAMTPDLKNKSIDTFFKPKRVPLAEMDVNCFTPSPSQQATLERNSGPWLSDTFSRPYLARTTTEPSQASPRSLQSPAARSPGRALSFGAMSASSSRPQKRARLCADDPIDNSVLTTPNSELGRSRFFNSNLPDPSPSVRPSKIKRGKEDEIGIFSDDSVEEALLSLPDFNGFSSQAKESKKGKKFSIFEDGAQSLGETPPSTEQKPEDVQSVDSQSSVPNLTQGTSFGSSMEAPPSPLPTPRIMDLKDKFAFTPVATPSASALNAPHITHPSRIPIPVGTSSSSRLLSTFKKPIPVSTPLQRLGARATATQARLPATPPVTPSPIASTRVIRKVPFPEVVGERLLAAQKTPLPAVDDEETKVLVGLGNGSGDDKKLAFQIIGEVGSEDLIIRDSEEEDEGLSPSPDCKKMDLSRFAFIG